MVGFDDAPSMAHVFSKKSTKAMEDMLMVDALVGVM